MDYTTARNLSATRPHFLVSPCWLIVSSWFD
nr:MAG TPA: hypothetical protein [Caudoviricetes sp.]